MSLACLLLLGAGCTSKNASTPPDPTHGHLIKGTTITTVYYLGPDGKRYVFPNDKTYLSWFPTFSYVRRLSDEELIKTPLSGNVTYKPGSRLVKIETDPRVYIVTHGGVLRELANEDIAKQIFGNNWRSQVDDLADPFFVNYKLGQPITSANEFSLESEVKNTTSIDQDKGLVSASTTTP